MDSCDIKGLPKLTRAAHPFHRKMLNRSGVTPPRSLDPLG